MRRVDHPGPINEPAVQSEATRIYTVQAQIDAGQTLLEGFTALMQQWGCSSAVATLGPAQFLPAVYVMPALSTSPEHAVYYSEKFYPSGAIVAPQSVVTIGLDQQGQTWIHCHARWTESDGSPGCGHLLPDATFLAQPVAVTLSLLVDAGFKICADAQTNFNLFKPTPLLNSLEALAERDASHGWCVRLSPNVDLCAALEDFAAQQGADHLQVLGGVGSTVGALFDDGRVVEPFVTELLIRQGSIRRDAAGQWSAALDIDLVDYTGAIHHGRLSRRDNPVLVTCELVLVPM